MIMFDIIIIGAGPGGYEMAAEAAAKGLTVGIVERDLLGGTCLNRGCIPTKALCRNAEVVNLIKESTQWGVNTGEVTIDYATAFARKNEVVTQLREGVAMLMGQPGITVINGEARFKDVHTIEVNGETYEARNIVIATGSAPRGLPIEGADLCMTSDDVLAMDTLPKSMCIVGGGVIGMEFAAIFQSFGVEVTVIEYCKEILPPFDKDIAKRLKTVLTKRGIKIITQAAVKAVTRGDDGLLTVAYDAKGKEQSAAAERVLMSVGRQPVLPQGLDTIGVTVGRRGIEVDENMRTSAEGVYAIGDVNGLCMLAHAASAQGEVALAHIMGKPCHVRLDIVPSAVFTVPELSMVGLTEDQCAERGMNVVVKKSFFRSNGKAVSMAETDGLVKMIVDADSRLIVGCHICGAHAADLIQEVVMAMNAGATIDQLAASIHGHPTLTEVVMAAARQF
ncbi:MAG: dihydrolipoyl dehydrogenase [Muribaculaceae bacterium]|nr:dihydrolipoyl dehydrogenase [Muribaculaceae bacterium]